MCLPRPFVFYHSLYSLIVLVDLTPHYRSGCPAASSVYHVSPRLKPWILIEYSVYYMSSAIFPQIADLHRSSLTYYLC